MEHITSTPLAAQAGAIAAAIRAEASHQAIKAGMVAALHALILSALARLVTSLENLLQLWQAGALPSPASRPATPRAAAIQAPDATTPPLRQARARHFSVTRQRHARSATSTAAPAPSTPPFPQHTRARSVSGVGAAAACGLPMPDSAFLAATRRYSTAP